jgi:hypothetical protein
MPLVRTIVGLLRAGHPRWWEWPILALAPLAFVLTTCAILGSVIVATCLGRLYDEVPDL